MGRSPREYRYPPPPWKLRHVALGTISFWEVAPDMFVGDDDFASATRAFQEGRANPISFTRLKRDYSLAEVQEGPAPLRNFAGAYFEVVHGWTIWAGNREDAEHDFTDHGGLSAVGNYGVPVADVAFTGAPLIVNGEVPYKDYGLFDEPLPLNRYESRKTGEYVWEVEPGRFIYGVDDSDAKKRYAKYGASGTIAADSLLAKQLDLVPSPVDKPAPEPKRLRRFRDCEGDTWLLLDEEAKLYCGTDEDQARENPEDADSIEHAFVWAPFEELDPDNAVVAEYREAHELLSTLQTTDSPATQTDPMLTDDEPEEAPKMTTSTRKPPSFLPYKEDAHGRPWFEVSANRYVLTDPNKGMTVPQMAGDAWSRFATRGYEESSYGRSLNSINDSFGPMTDKGFTEVEPPAEKFSQDALGTAISRERCRCPKLDGEAEQEKWLKVEGNTFCVDCGKLRP